MRYGIFGDVHANLEALEGVIAAYKTLAIDKYLCIGDLVGYATNPSECVLKVKGLVEACVAGNHDWALINLFSVDKLNPEAKEALLWTRRFIDESSRNYLETLPLVFKNDDLMLVHGTLDNAKDFGYMTNGFIAWETFRLLKTKICFIGHTHIPGIFAKDVKDDVSYRADNFVELEDDKSYIVNVGSVGQPRDGNPESCFCIYDTKTKTVEIKRSAYNFNQARDKIIKAGLPKLLGDRLPVGR